MYRQLYQLGGIGTLPMDYGQPLQIPQQQQPMFTTTGSATSSPMLNYGQTGLGQAGGTPLNMKGGGIMRLGYQEGGLSDFYKGEEPIIPRIENIGGLLDQAEKSIGEPQNNFMSPLATTFSRFGMQEGGMGMDQEPMMQPQMQDQAMMQPQMMEPPLQGMEGQQSDIKDPQQALEIIIQMLIAQGIPPEQAREIALQMVQAVAQGGMEEMGDQRVEARFGGMMNNGREQYGLGSIFKGAAKAVSSVVSGVADAVKSVAKSPIGKIALATAAAYFGAPMLAGATQGTSFGSALFGSPIGGFGLEAISTPGLFGVGGQFAPLSGTLLGSNSLLGGLTSKLVGGGTGSGILSSLGGNVLGSLAGGFLGGSLSGAPQQQPGETTADYQKRVDQYKAQYAPLLNPTVQYPGNPFYPQTQMAANGGRIGYQAGGIGDLISQATREGFFETPMMANGGRIRYAMGAEVPTRKNQAGITELDYRETGGFVPPIGIKEKADDIPAMLSNNEFVFTADAVRNAGDGDVNQGAKKMYTLMKNLENGGQV